MRKFWDARAAEDPYFFVDSRLRYRDPDLKRFWEDGRRALDLVLDMLDVGIRPTDVVIEIGCGVGRITRPLAARASEVLALDVSERMLHIARETNQDLSNVVWLQGDGRSLAGIETGSADVCLSVLVFQHIPDPEITLEYVREMGRVLRPGGWAAFQISNDPSQHGRRPARERIPHMLRSLVGRAPRGQADPAWLGSAVELNRLIQVAGEAVLVVERMVGANTLYCVVLARKGTV